jgi:hypothetical protein
MKGKRYDVGGRGASKDERVAAVDARREDEQVAAHVLRPDVDSTSASACVPRGLKDARLTPSGDTCVMSMPESRSDACTAHATNAMARVGLRSSSIDLRASGMYASTTGADGASSMGVGASGGADADAAIGCVDGGGDVTALLRGVEAPAPALVLVSRGAARGRVRRRIGRLVRRSRGGISDEDVHEVASRDATRAERRALPAPLRRDVVGPVERHRDIRGLDVSLEDLRRERASELREGAHLGNLDAYRIAGSTDDAHAELDAHRASSPSPSARALDCESSRGDSLLEATTARGRFNHK